MRLSAPGKAFVAMKHRTMNPMPTVKGIGGKAANVILIRVRYRPKYLSAPKPGAKAVAPCGQGCPPRLMGQMMTMIRRFLGFERTGA